MLNWAELRPLQAMAASVLFKHRKLLLTLPRQYGGKTELGIRLVEDITSRPFTSSSLFLAKSRTAGRKMAREKFMRIFDSQKFQVNTETAYLKSHPTSICFMDSVDKDPDRIRGGTFAAIHWAEVAFSKLEGSVTIMDVFGKVIKPTTELQDGYVLLETTLNGKNGYYDLWENYRDFGFHRLKVSFSDMVYLGLVSPEEYERVKSETLPEIFQQEYECEWVSFQGRAYPEFTEQHIDKDMLPPQDWQITVMGIDWGFSPSATCVLFAYVKDGHVYVYDELYATEELAIKTAENILAKREEWHIREFAAVADHEEDRITELNSRGIICGKADKVDTFGARMQIKEAFFLNRLHIHPRCKNLIRDLQAAVWHPKKENDIDYTQCTWGHFDAEAALRYLIRELSTTERQEPIANPHKAMDQISAKEWRAQQARRMGTEE